MTRESDYESAGVAAGSGHVRRRKCGTNSKQQCSMVVVLKIRCWRAFFSVTFYMQYSSSSSSSSSSSRARTTYKRKVDTGISLSSPPGIWRCSCCYQVPGTVVKHDACLRYPATPGLHFRRQFLEFDLLMFVTRTSMISYSAYLTST